MKVLVLLCYYDRPNMVQTALKSLEAQSYRNFEVAFVDDGSKYSGLDVLTSMELNFPWTYYNTLDTVEKKLERGYSEFGAIWNMACRTSDASIAIMLCDDDALYPSYLENLVEWFEANPEANYCFSNVMEFDPFVGLAPALCPLTPSYMNYGYPVSPSCSVDASQVAWKRQKAVDAGIFFDERRTKNLDCDLYVRMDEAWGLCPPTNFLGQYKARYADALSYRPNEYNPRDLAEPTQ